jgi:hypothetical protein
MNGGQENYYPGVPSASLQRMYIGLLGAHFASPKLDNCNPQKKKSLLL